MTFGQGGYRCRLEWGWQGAKSAAQRGDILVVVDTLRFSTTAVTALHYGATIAPCATVEEMEALAGREGVEQAYKPTVEARFSLSPLSFIGVAGRARVAMASPNGAACCRYGGEAPALLVGTLLNAEAVAKVVMNLLRADTGKSVSVIACGERWTIPNEDGELRFAIEDYLGAGAVLSQIPYSQSPEARLCSLAYQQAIPELESLLCECGSGRELLERGRKEDVLHAAQLNRYTVVPTLRDGWLVPFE